MKVKIFVTPQKQTVDPAGITVCRALHQQGYTIAMQVAIGRYLEIDMSAEGEREALEEVVTNICTDVRLNLVNPIMEDWRAEVAQPDGQVIHIQGKGRRKQ